MGVSLCCQRSIPGSGESPCSTKSNLPPGLRTRRISRNATSGSGIEQSVQVITTVSIVLSASGIAIADACSNSAWRPAASTRRRAIASKRGEGSNPDYALNLLAIERKVKPRSDPDFEHPTAGSSNHLAAIFLELVLPHDQIEDRWQYPTVIEVHDDLSASHCSPESIRRRGRVVLPNLRTSIYGDLRTNIQAFTSSGFSSGATLIFLSGVGRRRAEFRMKINSETT